MDELNIQISTNTLSPEHVPLYRYLGGFHR